MIFYNILQIIKILDFNILEQGWALGGSWANCGLRCNTKKYLYI